ncbi:uncharacterized protein LOC117182295 [Belonocnema kinseyi]|uniref:uncharacterized protein LOC117182295 n=1 Tax=Belonocnema kinseyi TaxID=2817044 RepID=UPI00143CDB62|nr:uncharacterized protein LOC117182295 [Belonocnema kinseyi]
MNEYFRVILDEKQFPSNFNILNATLQENKENVDENNYMDLSILNEAPEKSKLVILSDDPLLKNIVTLSTAANGTNLDTRFGKIEMVLLPGPDNSIDQNILENQATNDNFLEPNSVNGKRSTEADYVDVDGPTAAKKRFSILDIK